MKKLIIPFLISTLFISCKKDNGNNKNCSLSTASVAGSYKVTAVKYKPTPTSAEQDYFNTLYPDACEKDDIITFNTNGTYTFTDAGVKCSPAADDNGTWSLGGNFLIIDGFAEEVGSFNCNTLSIFATDLYNTGDKLTIVLTRQ